MKREDRKLYIYDQFMDRFMALTTDFDIDSVLPFI